MNSKVYLLLIVLTMGIVSLAAMYSAEDDDIDRKVNATDDDDNNDKSNMVDDDNNDNDTSVDDDSGTGPDYIEGPHCTGFDFPECGTEIDVPPQLISVAFVVNGEYVTQPITIRPTDTLTFELEFEYPNGNLCGGHIFLVKDDQILCMDKDGLPEDDSFPAGIPGICSTEGMGKPFVFKFDPLNFLNGDGAPYYLEISNDCATHSNRLPLDIVTESGGDSSNDDDDSSGHFSCS